MGYYYREIRARLEEAGLMEENNDIIALNKKGKAAIRALHSGSSQRNHYVAFDEDIVIICNSFGIRYEEVTFNQCGRKMLLIENYQLQKCLIFDITGYKFIMCN